MSRGINITDGSNIGITLQANGSDDLDAAIIVQFPNGKTAAIWSDGLVQTGAHATDPGTLTEFNVFEAALNGKPV